MESSADIKRKVKIFGCSLFVGSLLAVIALAVPGAYYSIEDETSDNPTTKIGLWKWCVGDNCKRLSLDKIKQFFKYADESYTSFQCSRVSSALSLVFLLLGLLVGLVTLVMKNFFHKWMKVLSYAAAWFLLLASVLLYIGSICFSYTFGTGYANVGTLTYYYSWGFAYYISFIAASILLGSAATLFPITRFYSK